MVEGKGPLLEVERSLPLGTEWLFSDGQCFAAKPSKVKDLLMNQVSFILSKLKGHPWSRMWPASISMLWQASVK